jgi:hypothetical protein
MARRNGHIQLAKLAEEALAELEGNILEVILVPSRDPDCAMRGGMIRCVASKNARWYREFCERYESNRRRARNKPDTMIRRQWTRRGLNELIEGKCETIYAQRLKTFIRSYARENGLSDPLSLR